MNEVKLKPIPTFSLSAEIMREEEEYRRTVLEPMRAIWQAEINRRYLEFIRDGFAEFTQSTPNS